MTPKVTLPSTVVSPQDLASLLLEIRRYNKWFQAEIIKQKTGVQAPNAAPALSTEATILLQTIANGGAMQPDTLTEFITELERIKKSAPTVTITLADIPTGALRTQLAEWCRTNIDALALIRFTCNRRILGGMVVRYGSRMFDWSFRSKLMANRGALPEVLRRV